MSLRTVTLAAGSAGMVFVVAGLFDTAQEPPDGADAETLRRWYETNLDTIGLSVTAAALEFGALLVFVAALVHLLRSAGPRRGVFTGLAATSGALAGGWIWLHAATAMMPIVLADENRQLDAVPDGVIAGLAGFRTLGETIGDLSAVPRGLFLLSVSLLVLGSRVLPRWIAWFGLFVAAASLVCVVGPAWWIAPFGIASMIGLFGFLIWMLLAAVALVVRAARMKSPVPTA